METIKELENKINDVEETLNNLKAKVEELKRIKIILSQRQMTGNLDMEKNIG